MNHAGGPSQNNNPHKNYPTKNTLLKFKKPSKKKEKTLDLSSLRYIYIYIYKSLKNLTSSLPLFKNKNSLSLRTKTGSLSAPSNTYATRC
jgi:hypothetical protein